MRRTWAAVAVGASLLIAGCSTGQPHPTVTVTATETVTAAAGDPVEPHAVATAGQGDDQAYLDRIRFWAERLEVPTPPGDEEHLIQTAQGVCINLADADVESLDDVNAWVMMEAMEYLDSDDFSTIHGQIAAISLAAYEVYCPTV